MSLDCNTENGRRYISYQHLCLQSFCAAKKVNYATTTDTSDADVDAILWRSSIVGVAEVKTRNLTHQQLSGFGSYLVRQRRPPAMEERQCETTPTYHSL